MSQTHKTQFTEHFIYQGKVLEIIATTMLRFNRLTLDTVITQFQAYMYTAGLGIILLFAILLSKWVRGMEKKVYLSKMALTLIPADSLNE